MSQAIAVGIDLRATDVSGGRSVRATGVPGDTTVGELLKALLAKMGLTRNDAQGRPLAYRARLEREGRHLRGSEQVGDALRPGDEIVLQPTVDAG